MPFLRESRILLVISVCLLIFPRHVCPARLPCQDFPSLRLQRDLTHPAGTRARTVRRLPALFFPAWSSRAWSAPRLVCPAWSSRAWSAPLVFPAWSSRAWSSRAWCLSVYLSALPGDIIRKHMSTFWDTKALSDGFYKLFTNKGLHLPSMS